METVIRGLGGRLMSRARLNLPSAPAVYKVDLDETVQRADTRGQTRGCFEEQAALN